jgi:hypothetical protein
LRYQNRFQHRFNCFLYLFYLVHLFTLETIDPLDWELLTA